MLVNNPISNDPRVKSAAFALKNAGHDVVVIGKIKPGFTREDIWNGIKFNRLLSWDISDKFSFLALKKPNIQIYAEPNIRFCS